MDYGKYFSRAWNLIWENKFLIVLGILVALGGAGGGGGGQGAVGGNGDWDMQAPPRFDFDFSAPIQNLGLPFAAVGGILILAAFAVLIGLALWVVSTISRGGLIHGADAVSRGMSSNFSEAFRAGWEKGWRLIGIGLVPAIPGILLGVITLFSLGIYGGMSVVLEAGDALVGPRAGVFFPAVILICILVPLMLVLSLLRTFANRACMLEDAGVFAAYRRGFTVLGENLGSAIVLFLLQVAISIGIWLVLLLPGVLIALCCFLWPLLLVIQGTFAAFYSTLWTLAWNRWTGREVTQADAVPAA